MHTLKEAIGDFQKSPYKGRIFVVLDSSHSVKLGKIEGMGVPKENIIVWSRNGIEYYYPREVLAEIFSCGLDYDFDAMSIDGHAIIVNGIRKEKGELADEVVKKLAIYDSATPIALPQELNDFINMLKQVTL